MYVVNLIRAHSLPRLICFLNCFTSSSCWTTSYSASIRRLVAEFRSSARTQSAASMQLTGKAMRLEDWCNYLRLPPFNLIFSHHDDWSLFVRHKYFESKWNNLDYRKETWTFEKGIPMKFQMTIYPSSFRFKRQITSKL